MRGQRFAQHDEGVIHHHQTQSDADADVRLAPVNTDAQRNADEREAKTSERKGDFPVHRHPHPADGLLPHLFRIAQKLIAGGRRIGRGNDLVQSLQPLPAGGGNEICAGETQLPKLPHFLSQLQEGHVANLGFVFTIGDGIEAEID